MEKLIVVGVDVRVRSTHRPGMADGLQVDVQTVLGTPGAPGMSWQQAPIVLDLSTTPEDDGSGTGLDATLLDALRRAALGVVGAVRTLVQVPTGVAPVLRPDGLTEDDRVAAGGGGGSGKDL